MKKFCGDHALLRRYLCAIFALVCIFFVFSSQIHHCHGAGQLYHRHNVDCPVCALQEVLGSVLPATVFFGFVRLLLALLSIAGQAYLSGLQQTLVQLKVKLSD